MERVRMQGLPDGTKTRHHLRRMMMMMMMMERLILHVARTGHAAEHMPK
jgi:hypothetical protein